MLLLADAAAQRANDLERYQWGMVFIGVVVLVLWVLFRRLFKDDDAPGKDDRPKP